MTDQDQKKPKSGRSRPPAYQWYPAEAHADRRYRVMSLEERGAYRELLDMQWLDGPLPLDHEELAALLGVDLERFEQLWKRVGRCFEETEDGYINPRMERELERLDCFRDKCAEAGRKGAARKKTKGRARVPLADPSPTLQGSGKGQASTSASAAAATTAAAAAAESPPRASAPAREEAPPGEARQTRPPDPAHDPRTWSFDSPPKDGAWADWLEYQGQLERPPTEKTLSKHWHRLLAWTDAEAVAVVEAAIELGARAFTAEIVRRALADVAAAAKGAAAQARTALETARAWPLPDALGDAFEPTWARWLDHHGQQTRPPTEAQLWLHLEHLTALGSADAARRAVDFAIGRGMTAFSDAVLRIAREGETATDRNGRILPGPGTRMTPEELAILGWPDDGRGTGS